MSFFIANISSWERKKYMYKFNPFIFLFVSETSSTETEWQDEIKILLKNE